MIFIVRLRFLGALVSVVLVWPATTAHAQAPPGLTHVGTERTSSRVDVVRLSTPALGGPTQVRVLLPDDYDPSGATRYPVLYILHGATGDSTRWLELGGAKAATAGHDLIVVMPEGGLFGFYTDWWNLGAGGPPQWETYHLGQLIPWIDANYPTVASRDGRAIAGESMGGLGAMHYAATRPDLFTAAASFSGAIDTNHLLAPPIIDLAVMAEHQHLPAAAFGPRLTEEIRYRGHNPVDLAENLRGLLLQLDTGDGRVGGPLGALGVPGLADPVEVVMHEMGLRMHQRLDALGIAHGWNPFPGCHCWPQWADDLERLVPPLMDRFADPAPPPSPFSYLSIDASYGVYGWDVTVDRPAVEFSRLFDAGPDGFGLTGSGSARVTTASMFEPSQEIAVTVTAAGATTTATIAADGDGRLTVPVSLGAGNPVQQHSLLGHVWAPLAGAAPGGWPAVTATVRFDPAVAPAGTAGAIEQPADSDDDGETEATGASRGPRAVTPATPATPAMLPTTGADAGDRSAALLAAALALLVAVCLRGRVRAAGHQGA